MKIVTIVGARPQFIKAAVVTRELAGRTDVREVLVHTGQHYDDSMSRIFFEQLGLPEPDFNLGIGSGPHGAQTGRMLEAVETVMLKEKPDWVLVYGDTNSTLAGALAAAKLGLPLAHVEAGLRSYQRAMPEEINRVLTDQVSDLLFVPTGSAVRNLQREGIAEEKIRLVGDVMYDAALQFVGKADAASLLRKFGLRGKRFALVTLHRAENTDDKTRLSTIIDGLSEMARSIEIITPLHPRTRAALERDGMWARASGAMQCIEPLGYLDMLALEKEAAMIVTDSGGVQKEAFFFGTPCLILRPKTEWVELIELGCARLCEPQDLATAVQNLPRPEGAPAQSLFGGGRAGQLIVDALLA
jgi:UDP-GlcNAc3NAcA epimerase